MAKENKSAIFRDENGNPHRFYMYPCDLEEEIRNNIEAGGGSLSSKVQPGAIKLVEPGACSADKINYYSTDFIFKCVQERKFFKLENFRFGNLQTSEKARPSRVRTPVISYCLTPRRWSYSPEDDQALLEFVAKNAKEKATAGGNVLWKRAEERKITPHPWQSMRDRYLKRLKPQHTQPILTKTIKLLTQSFWLPGLVNPKFIPANAVSNLHVSDLSDSEGELTDLSQELDRELIAAAQRHMKTQSRPHGTGDDSFGDDIKGLDSDSSNGLCLSEAGGRDSPCLFPYRRSLRKRKISTSSSESDSDLSLKLQRNKNSDNELQRVVLSSSCELGPTLSSTEKVIDENALTLMTDSFTSERNSRGGTPMLDLMGMLVVTFRG